MSLSTISDAAAAYGSLSQAMPISKRWASEWDFGFRAILDHLAIFGHYRDCLDATQVRSGKPTVRAETAHK